MKRAGVNVKINGEVLFSSEVPLEIEYRHKRFKFLRIKLPMDPYEAYERAAFDAYAQYTRYAVDEQNEKDPKLGKIKYPCKVDIAVTFDGEEMDHFGSVMANSYGQLGEKLAGLLMDFEEYLGYSIPITPFSEKGLHK